MFTIYGWFELSESVKGWISSTSRRTIFDTVSCNWTSSHAMQSCINVWQFHNHERDRDNSFQWTILLSTRTTWDILGIHVYYTSSTQLQWMNINAYFIMGLCWPQLVNKWAVMKCLLSSVDLDPHAALLQWSLTVMAQSHWPWVAPELEIRITCG